MYMLHDMWLCCAYVYIIEWGGGGGGMKCHLPEFWNMIKIKCNWLIYSIYSLPPTFQNVQTYHSFFNHKKINASVEITTFFDWA